MKKIIDKTFFLYVILGFVNYFACSAIMLIFRNVLRLEEDLCLIIAFALQTINSFILNRYVTFRGIELEKTWPIKFVVSVAAAYVISKVLLKRVFQYLINVPFFSNIVDWLKGYVGKGNDNFRENLVMLACTFTYCVINYVGQRYFVFRARKQGTGNP